MIPSVQAPGIGAELTHEGMDDLKHIHAVEAGEKSFVALVVGRAMKLSFAHNSLVIAAEDLADQIEVLLERVRIAPESSDEVPVEAVSDVQPQSVNVKIVHPVPDRVEDMRDDFLVSEIELDQVVIALPALVPEAVVVRGISVEADIEPILIGGFPSSLQDILELRESAASPLRGGLHRLP